MMGKCLICGEEYEVCPYCPTTIKATPWRTVCCSREHFVIYMLVREFDAGIIDSQEAREYIKETRMDLSDKGSFDEGVQKIIKRIMEE